MPKKLWIVLIIGFALSGLFAKGAEEQKSMEKVTISIAYPVAVDAPISEVLEGYASDFMAAHPEVTVETVYSGGYGDVKTAIQTGIDGGSTVPALAVMLATDLFDLVNAEYVEPMDQLLSEVSEDQDIMDDFLPAFTSNSYYLDSLWSLPFQRSAVVMYYNADLLKENGISQPQNWKELAEAAAALTERKGDTVTRWGIEWPSGWPYWLFQPLAIGAGQNIVGDSDTEVYFDNPEVISAIQYYIDLSEKYKATPAGVQGSWGSVVPNFLSGNTAFIVHSSGSMSGILRDADFNVGVSAIPGPDSGAGFSVPGGGNLYLTAGLSEAEKKAAMEFALYLTTPEKVADFSIHTGYIATRLSAFDTAAMKEYIAEYPQAGESRNILSQAGKELAIQNLGEVRTIFHSKIQAAINGDLTPAVAMKEAQTEAEQALAAFK